MTAIGIPIEVEESRLRAASQFRGILRLRFALHRMTSDQALAYFLTTSTFSIMAMPPRSASLPLTVIVLPQYSAS
jgi:hypothetical protein